MLAAFGLLLFIFGGGFLVCLVKTLRAFSSARTCLSYTETRSRAASICRNSASTIY